MNDLFKLKMLFNDDFTNHFRKYKNKNDCFTYQRIDTNLLHINRKDLFNFWKYISQFCSNVERRKINEFFIISFKTIMILITYNPYTYNSKMMFFSIFVF